MLKVLVDPNLPGFGTYCEVFAPQLKTKNLDTILLFIQLPRLSTIQITSLSMQILSKPNQYRSIVQYLSTMSCLLINIPFIAYLLDSPLGFDQNQSRPLCCSWRDYSPDHSHSLSAFHFHLSLHGSCSDNVTDQVLLGCITAWPISCSTCVSSRSTHPPIRYMVVLPAGAPCPTNFTSESKRIDNVCHSQSILKIGIHCLIEQILYNDTRIVQCT